jgi:hypothetical protein
MSDRTVRARGTSTVGTLMLDNSVREESALIDLKGEPFDMDEDELVVATDIDGRFLFESLVDKHDRSVELVPVAR